MFINMGDKQKKRAKQINIGILATVLSQSNARTVTNCCVIYFYCFELCVQSFVDNAKCMLSSLFEEAFENNFIVLDCAFAHMTIKL